jgi:hypothetical protein
MFLTQIETRKTVTADIGIVMSILKKIKFENTIFYTRMYDAIATTTLTMRAKHDFV